jgi:hypothetical protein
MEQDNEEDHGFMIPNSFLTQLGEYTRGYMLLVCNEKGQLYAHEAYDNPVIKLGLINFADMHISASLKHMHNMALKDEEAMEGMDNDPDNDNEDMD